MADTNKMSSSPKTGKVNISEQVYTTYSARLQENFFLRLIKNTLVDQEEIERRMQEVNLSLTKPYFTVFTFISEYTDGRVMEDTCLFLLRETVETQRKKPEYPLFFCTDIQSRLYCIVNTDEPLQKKAFQTWFTSVQNRFSKIAGVNCFAGLGETVGNLSLLHKSAKSAVADLHKNIMGVLRTAKEDKASTFYKNREIIQDYLLLNFRENNFEEIVAAVRGHMMFLRSRTTGNPLDTESFLLVYIQSITNECMRLGITLERFEDYVPAVVHLMQSDSVACAEAVLKLTEQIMKYISVHRTSETNHLLNMAKEYIRDHIADERLSLETVSDYVGLSRVYFCRLFHKMEGVTFSSYIRKERIEKAKQLLLTTNMKVFEVSSAVGFSHAKYFCQVFKQYVGQTPMEYQRFTHE